MLYVNKWLKSQVIACCDGPQQLLYRPSPPRPLDFDAALSVLGRGGPPSAGVLQRCRDYGEDRLLWNQVGEDRQKKKNPDNSRDKKRFRQQKFGKKEARLKILTTTVRETGVLMGPYSEFFLFFIIAYTFLKFCIQIENVILRHIFS